MTLRALLVSVRVPYLRIYRLVAPLVRTFTHYSFLHVVHASFCGFELPPAVTPRVRRADAPHPA